MENLEYDAISIKLFKQVILKMSEVKKLSYQVYPFCLFQLAGIMKKIFSDCLLCAHSERDISPLASDISSSLNNLLADSIQLFKFFIALLFSKAFDEEDFAIF